MFFVRAVFSPAGLLLFRVRLSGGGIRMVIVVKTIIVILKVPFSTSSPSIADTITLLCTLKRIPHPRNTLTTESRYQEGAHTTSTKSVP